MQLEHPRDKNKTNGGKKAQPSPETPTNNPTDMIVRPSFILERTQLGGQLHTYIYIYNKYIYMYMIIFIIHLIFGTYTDIRSFNYLHKVSSLSTLVHETQNIPKRLSDQPTTSCFWEVMKQAYIYSAATAPFTVPAWRSTVICCLWRQRLSRVRLGWNIMESLLWMISRRFPLLTKPTRLRAQTRHLNTWFVFCFPN